jgi:hypothetical protein
MSTTGWIGVDLDGTLAYYDEWKGPEHIGPPIPIMVDRVRLWLSEGSEVKIFTARCSDRPTLSVPAIKAWCLTHIGVELEVTNIKDFKMKELWDDRAIRVETNTGHVL